MILKTLLLILVLFSGPGVLQAVRYHSFSFNMTGQKEPIKKIITLSNRSPGLLEINGIAADCSCMDVRILPAGRIRIGSEGKQAFIPGRHVFPLQIIFNKFPDGRNSTIKIFIRGILGKKKELFVIRLFLTR
ncbi:MAG: hypothetical protein PHF84_08190 [bacterium]|nr:hypothetical protein [bacterium]